MVASTFGAGLAAVKDLPTPFVDSEGVFDAYVVVGANAGISDLVGAVEVAAAFAQNAKISAGEGSVIEKNVTPGILSTVGATDMLYFGKTASAKTWDAGTDGFGWLLNETVEYNDTEYELHSYVKTKGTLNTLYNDGIFNWRTDDGVAYNITANDTLPVGFDEFDFLGDRYQIVSAGTGELALGQIEEVTMNLNEATEVGGVATITALDIDQVHSKVKIAVQDSDDNLVEEEWYAEGGVFDNDTIGLKFTVDSFYHSLLTGISEVTLNWETSSIELEHGVDYVSDGKNWTVSLEASASGFTSLELGIRGGFQDEERFPSSDFSSGDKMDLLGGLFSIEYMSIMTADASDDEPGEFTQITVADSIDSGAVSGSEPELIYEDSEGNDVELDLSTINDIEVLEDNMTDGIFLFDETVFSFYHVENQYGDVNITVLNETGSVYEAFDGNGTDTGTFWVNVTEKGKVLYQLVWDNTTMNQPVNLSVLTVIANGTYFEDNLTYVVSGDAGTLTFTEKTGDTIVVDFNTTTGDIDGDDITVTGFIQSEFDDGDQPGYTAWGSYVDYDNGAISIEYPETRRYAKITVGRSTTEVETVAVGDEIPDSDWTLKAGGGDLIKAFEPKFAYMDTEKATPDKPVILIGGPAINALVSGMGNETWALSDWREEVNGTRTKTNRALIDLVEDAFSTYDALVVAGYEAVDTRIAARLLAKELMYGGTILGDVATDRAVLDTTDADGSAESYTAATLVE
jgi:hypothetical protein